MFAQLVKWQRLELELVYFKAEMRIQGELVRGVPA